MIHGAQGVHFLGYQPEPQGKPDNLHLLPSADWPGGDLIASSHAIVAKAGYGTVCEAMARGTPMIYPPRSCFAEYRSLDRALRSWGGGVPISSRDFFALKLDRALTLALEIRPGPAPYPTDGAKQIASHLVSLCRYHAAGRSRWSPALSLEVSLATMLLQCGKTRNRHHLV